MNDKRDVTLTDGSPVTPDHRELLPNGQQKGYVVLSAEERAKGFVRPVRTAYRHVGKQPTHPLRDLTPEEKERFAPEGYVKFEQYPEDRHPCTGDSGHRHSLTEGAALSPPWPFPWLRHTPATRSFTAARSVVVAANTFLSMNSFGRELTRR